MYLFDECASLLTAPDLEDGWLGHLALARQRQTLSSGRASLNSIAPGWQVLAYSCGWAGKDAQQTFSFQQTFNFQQTIDAQLAVLPTGNVPSQELA